MILEAESQARVVDVLDSRWVQSELGKSSSRSRGDATGRTLPLSTPLDPKVHHADLAWRRKGFLGGRRMKIKLRRLHGNERTAHAPMLLFARQVIRCGVSAKVLLKATLISGSRLGCFTYGWLTLLEFMVQFMWIVELSCSARMAFLTPFSMLRISQC